LNLGDAWYQHAGENLLPLLVRSKNVRMKVHKIIIIYRRLWSVIWSDELGLILSEKTMLRKDGWKEEGGVKLDKRA
jgi:hypothetical protein